MGYRIGSRRSLFKKKNLYTLLPTEITGLRAWHKSTDDIYQDSAKTTPAASNNDPIDNNWASKRGITATKSYRGWNLQLAHRRFTRDHAWFGKIGAV